MKRSLSVFGIVLFLLVYVPLSSGLGLAETLVVDDDGRDCPWAAYSSIQEAADAAQGGDKILVCAGTYAGATVEKKLHFRAKGKVVINDGPNSHSFLRAGFLFPAGGGGSGSSIHGFRFEGRPQFGYVDDGYLDFPIFSRGADRVVVERNLMVNSLQAITNWNGSGWRIRHNEIRDLWTLNGGGIGILVGGNNAGKITDNLVSKNKVTGLLRVWEDDCGEYDGTGIVLYADFRSGRNGAEEIAGNRLAGNTISMSSDSPDLVNFNGIELTDTRDDNTADPVIFHNNISQNRLVEIGRDGITLSGGCTWNWVLLNKIKGSGRYGMSVNGLGNFIWHNKVKESEVFDCFDTTSGDGTGGTANVWLKNHCDTSSPPGLCGCDDKDEREDDD